LAVQVAFFGRRVPGSEPITGTPEEVETSLRALAAEGIGHVQVILAPTTSETVAGFRAVLDLLDRG
jgi:hypothetical protein